MLSTDEIIAAAKLNSPEIGVKDLSLDDPNSDIAKIARRYLEFASDRIKKAIEEGNGNDILGGRALTDEQLEMFRYELREHIPHSFSPKEYNIGAIVTGAILPRYFDIPNGDWSKVVNGKENIEQYLGDPNKKLVFFPAPHNTHFDEFLVGKAFWENSIGDLRIGARTNLFLGPGKNLKDWGSYALSFYESFTQKWMKGEELQTKWPIEMIRASLKEVESYFENTLLPQANDRFKFDGFLADYYAHPLIWAADGRSYNGEINLKTRTNLEMLLEIQRRHPEWDIMIVPVTETHFTVPEQDLLHRINEFKDNPKKYIKKDYLNLLKVIGPRMLYDWFLPATKSDFHIDIHKPISLKDNDYFLSTENNKNRLKKARNIVGTELDGTIKDGYRPLPEKVLATAIIDAVEEEIAKGESVSKYKLYQNVERRIDELAGKDRNMEHLQGHVRELTENAIDSYINWGALKTVKNDIIVKKPHIITYQANTIDHLFK